MNDTIFQQIIDKKLPAVFLHEDDFCIVIEDKYPKSAVHLLIIPKKRISSIADALDEDQSILGHLILVARDIAKKKGLAGYKLVFNVGKDGGQEIMHLHLHLLG